MKKINFFYVMLLSGFIAICQNPQQLKDVYPGSTGSGIQQIVKTSNYTFFNADDDDVDLDRGLYRTDGTAGGTIKLNLTYPTYISTKAEKLTALGDKVVFAGDNSANYGEIWASNGTQGGTIALERFQPTASGVLPVKELKAMGTNVFYSVVDGNNHAVLKKTDGTPGGTSVVYDFSAYTGIPEVVYLTPLNNILYFVVYDAGGTGVDQLWRSDGTTGGTYMLMNFGTGQYLASFLMPAGNNIYAMIVKSGTGNVLWKSDGTVAGTVSVKTIGITGNNNYPHNAAIGSTLFFAGLDGNGKELWKTDGTEAGTMMVQNINAGAASSNPTLLTALNNNLYFYADGGINGNELWKFDGSSASEVLDIYPGSTGSKPLSNSSFQLGFVESNGTIVFNAANDATGQELWITDGTAANTKKIKDINPLGASNPSVLTPGNPVYFSANNGVNGAEIFKYDNSDGVLGLKNVWLTGSAFGEWKQSGVIKMTNNGGGIFTATNIQIVGDGKFKFTEGTWASAAGYSAIPGFPTGVTVVPGTDITGTLGFWNVTYNFVTKAYSFVPTPTDNWGVVGSATPNDWVGPDMPLTYDAISNKWSAVVSLNNGEIKFRNNNDWSVNYGDNDADGSLDTNGANIAIAGGRYLITLDFNTLKYSIKSALVAIPDPNFEQALIDLGIDKDGVVNASISRSDAEAVIDLNVNGKNISSLSGIEHFTNLRYLYCNNNSLTELNLGDKPNLINLHCGSNALTSIDLTNYPNLTSLQIYLNKLTSLDLSHNPNLEELLCSSNKLTSMDISGNSKLKFMNFADNKLVNLNIANDNNANFTHPGWANFSFDARYNPALMCIKADASIISSIPSDWFKDSSANYNIDCPIINCDELVVIPDANFEQALIDLGFDTNGLNGTIKKCEAASVLDLNLNGKNISSLAGIEHFVALRNLYCNDNSKTLTAINLGNKPNLINFQCERNAITSIDLSNCPNLEEFLIGGNKLTTLDVSNNSKLKSLVCSSNLLTTIDVSNNSNLNFIHVANNKLVNLNIANGNNLNFAPLFWTTIAMNALNNFSLSCIKVDSGIINTIPSNWSKDVTSGYSTDSCESLPIIYVNDTIQIGDVYTTTVGNDSNPGTAALPFETIQKAISRIAIGGVIYVDAGAYEEQLTINKGITIIGAGKELTSILKPATVVAPPGPFTEKGVIQTSQNIGDVFIEKMSITGGTGVTPVIIQSGGGVKNCKLQNGNQGIFFRIESGTKTAVVENNVINAEYIGVNFQGAGLTASLINNTISVANQGFSAGVFAGLDFGPLTQFTVNGNSINNYVTYGLLANSNNSNITLNSIVGVGGLAFSTNTSLQASCNWFGTKEAATIASRISGAVNYTPWLTNGTDSDIVSYGFQPLPDVCNGPLPLAITLDASANVTCKGTTNGTISITASDGLAPYSFLWTNSDNPEFSSSSEDLTNLAAGTYQLLLTDTNGSTVSLTNIVISEPDLLIASASGTNAICFGASNGTASVLADGGTAPYTYLWSNNETTEEITNLAAGIYSVTVTDANQCTAIANYEVTHPALLTATIANNSTICSNNATVTASAGTPGYTYLWSNGATTASINNVPTGTYSVVVTDGNGCTTTASITLTVTEAFNPSASVINVSCFGGSNGAITVTNANGTPPFTFSKDGGAFLNGSLPYSFNGLSAGTYNIAVKDANGCVGFVAKTISQPSSLNIILNTVQSSCYGQSTGAITVTVTGGTGALSYNWTGPNNFASSKSSINNLAAGNYSFTVIDNNGCTATLPLIVVPSLNEITVNAAVTNVLCRATLTGAINLTVTGGTNSGFTYSWTGALISTSEDLSNIGSANNYNVTITDIGSGCVITRSYSITQPASNLSLTAAKTNATGCSSMGTITATGSGGTSPYQYSKNGLDYQSTGLFTGLSGGNYTVWVKDVNSCTATKAVSITDSGTDEFEGNNSKNQAKPISIGAVNYARIAVATDVADWFKFTTPSGSANYIVTLTPPNPSVSYSFNVYASGNNTPALVPSSFSTTTKQYLLAGGTTYYISITGGLSFDCYSLVVSSGIAAKTANPLVTNTKKEPIVVSTEILKVITYPNPHHGSFSLKIETPEDGLATVQLFTINGQFLAEKQVYVQKGNENSIPFESVSLGTILYRVQIGKNLVAGKVIGKE